MENNQEKWIAFICETDEDTWREDESGFSREEVIEIGMKLAKEEGLKSFQIGKVVECGMSTIDVTTILEHAQEQLYDEVGESSEDYLSETTNEQENELEEALNEVFYQWHKKHNLFPNCYTIINCEVIEVK